MICALRKATPAMGGVGVAVRGLRDYVRGWELLTEGEGKAGYFADGDLVGRCEGLVADGGVEAEAGGVGHVGDAAASDTLSETLPHIGMSSAMLK